MKTRAVWIGVFLTVGVCAAWAEPPEPSRVTGAEVVVTAPYLHINALVIGDRRTVVMASPGLETGRTLSVSPRHGEGTTIDADDVRLVGGQRDGVYVLHLEHETTARPLALSAVAPEIGMKVHVLMRSGQEWSWASTTIVSVMDGRFAVAKLPRPAGVGRLVVAPDGKALGMTAGGTSVHTLTHALERAPGAPGRSASLLPLVGFRFGAELSGLEEAALLQMDVGLTLWDRLSLVTTIGGAFNDESKNRVLPAGATTGNGVVRERSGTFRAGLEARYRQLLSGSSTIPIYLDLVVGGQYGLTTFRNDGPVLWGQPGCNPATSHCSVMVGELDDRRVEHSVGMSIGADLRMGGMSLGYRFMPEATGINLGNTHQILFGLSFW